MWLRRQRPQRKPTETQQLQKIIKKKDAETLSWSDTLTVGLYPVREGTRTCLWVRTSPNVCQKSHECSCGAGSLWWDKRGIRLKAFNGASWWRCMYLTSLKLMGIIWPLMNWMRTETIKQRDAVSSLLLLCFSFWNWCSALTIPVIQRL